jgi:hypothetical protein
MKKIITIIILSVFFISCSAEKRIKYYSYTDEWYYYDSERYQVYQTRFGEKYILIYNDKQTKLKRKYIKVR